MGVVSKQFLVSARSLTRHLDPPRHCPLSLQAPSPAWTLYKAILAIRGCPGLSPQAVAKVGDLAETRKHLRHNAMLCDGGSSQVVACMETGCLDNRYQVGLRASMGGLLGL
jgi:hypothetical protein